MDDIKARLDELADIQAAVDVARLDYEAKRSAILATVQAELDALDAEYEPLFDASQQRIATLTDEIKSLVLTHGASVKSDRLQAVYTRGRVTWDTASLDRYAASHPEVVQFRKQGEPSVSLRVVSSSTGGRHRQGLAED